MLKLILASLVILFETGIHTHKVPAISGGEIDFGDFSGKKILVVNIATNSPRVVQIGQLQQLHQTYSDSLVIVAFPSNSFGNENRSNSEILQLCQSQYNTGFLIAAKGDVKGESIQLFYQWLTNREENGVFNNEVKGDFQKYLFDRNGRGLGVFSGSLSPLSPQLVNAITGN
ncbi:MAG TPA: glutathione peroxidase [Chitinophagaceae bacterium]